MLQAVISSDLVFWVSWIVIPLIVEILPAIGSFIFLLFKSKKKNLSIQHYPEITVIIPVYNSAMTLEKCIKSIDDSSYENDLINLMLIDNGSTDHSFDVFQECQMKYDLGMQWLTSNQGKSKALNKGLFNSKGKYIINVDSDGRLEENAIKNIIEKFENDIELHGLTGVILTEQEEIKDTESFMLRQIRKMEFLEYCQAFLVGRNFNSSLNTMFTVSGAFSAFKKSSILKSFLYNSNTLSEDAHITFQLKEKDAKIGLCNDAIFYVSPIDDMDKLYTQRQRWQIGELEVFHMFNKGKLSLRKMFSNRDFKVLLFDHTLSFPRMIWYFALFILSSVNYSFTTVLCAMLLIYLLYVLTGLLFGININMFLKDFKEDRKFFNHNILYMIFYPIYFLYIFILRFMGIINSIKRTSTWKTYTFKEELSLVKTIIKNDFSLKKEKRG